MVWGWSLGTRLSPSLPSPLADQRNMGMSMKVEKSSLDQVRKRFEFNKKKKEEEKKTYGQSKKEVLLVFNNEFSCSDFEERMKELREEVE